MADTAALRKARGAFFTPAPIAGFLAEWGIRTPADTVLEPSCGEAAFLLAAADRLRAHGGEPTAEQLHGVELHAASVDHARSLLAHAGAAATITTNDFFDVEPTQRRTVALGNPPFIRYQDFSGAARARSQQAALAQGVRLTGLASSWAAFVVHTSQFLEPDGRMGLVLPAELLSVNYASDVRRFLLNRFASIKLVLFRDRVFPGVLEEVVLLLAEGTGTTKEIHVHQVADAEALTSADEMHWLRTTVQPDRKWSAGLLDSETVDVYEQLVAGEGFTELDESWGKSGIGSVTGNNKFFTLTGGEAAALGLPRNELRPISPPGSAHLRGLTFTERSWQDLIKQGRRGWLFYPSDTPSEAAQRYINDGEQRGVHEAYKCRVRKPWWRVPVLPAPDLFLTYMNHITPQLTANRAKTLHLNSVHGVILKPGRKQLGMDLLPLASLNSVTLLASELVGRAYGGGMLKLEPREADRLPVPSVALVEAAADDLRALRPQLTRHLRSGDLTGAARLVDRILLSQHLHTRQQDVARLRDGKRLLFDRRTARGKEGRGPS